MRALTLLASLIVLVVLPGCASVLKNSSVRPDYDATDKTQTKRLVVVVQPLPDGKAKVGELWALMARRYVHLKKQYIIKGTTVVDAPANAFQAQAVCTQTLEKLKGEDPEAKLEGALWLAPTVTAKELEVTAEVDAKLLRCSDGQQVWSASGGGHFDGADKKAIQQSWDYAAEFGSEVGPYVAPTWNLLRPVLDTLPDPVLNDADQEEKILSE